MVVFGIFKDSICLDVNSNSGFSFNPIQEYELTERNRKLGPRNA
jgi:hypothetical protein